MIDMEVRWSDGWKAGNVLQIYEKAVVIFAVGFFPFLQLIIWGIEELTDSTLRSLPHMFLMWFGILSSLLLILELSKSFFAWGRKRGMRLLSVIKENMVWFRSGDRNSCHFDRFVYQYIYLYTGTYCGAEWGADGSQCK